MGNERDETVDELVTLIVEHLVPVAGWYRDQVADRLGMSTAGLTVLEQARLNPTNASRAAGWTTMTPSAMTKVIRRLEEQGHVERRPSARHDQELMVHLVPHAERDRILASLRDRVRDSMEHLVSSFGLTDEGRRRIAANALVHASSTLGVQASHLERRAVLERMKARRYRARRAGGLHP